MAGLDCFADGDDGSKKRSPRRLIYLQGKIEHGDDTVYMAAETNGDGACALHATWGDVVGARYECLNARAKLYEDLSSVDGEDLDSPSSEFQKAFHSLLGTVRTDLNIYAKIYFCGNMGEVKYADKRIFVHSYTWTFAYLHIRMLGQPHNCAFITQ